MCNETIKNIGRRLRLIIRQPNGQISVFEGTLLFEDAISYTIKITNSGAERTEPKNTAAVEWITPAQEGRK